MAAVWQGMIIPLSNSTPSVFETRSIEEIYTEICDLYERYPQPWVLGYSGGKDSTSVLQLVWKALATLPPERRTKPVFVIATDTKVETPVIVETIDNTLNQIDEAARAQGMPFETHRLSPTLNDSFWVNLIGRGYPAPTTKFRWCTERLKINPSNRFIQEKVGEYGEVIMLLGIRSDESSTRGQLMNSYRVHDHFLLRHSYLPGAYVYAPIAQWTTDDVWTYLLQVPSPWGGDNRDLAALYRSASQGECPLVIDTSTPSCGSGRFGCWVCTVATRDSSMEAIVDGGEEWLEPLLEFRDWLMTTTEPARKREFRDIQGRDGRLVLSKDGSKAVERTYKLEVSRQMLRRVLQAQQDVTSANPNFKSNLIDPEELLEIRRIWRTERGDWEDTVPLVYQSVVGEEVARDFDWPRDDNDAFDGAQAAILGNVCDEYDVPLPLLTKLLEVERECIGMARRAGVHKGIAKVLGRNWSSEADFIEQARIEREEGPGGLFDYLQEQRGDEEETLETLDQMEAASLEGSR